MPIILPPEGYHTWLNTEIQGKDAKALLLDAQIDSQLEFHRFSREVNSSRYEGADTKTPLIDQLALTSIVQATINQDMYGLISPKAERNLQKHAQV